MKISVVVTTYNGEKYLEEQLESIKNQTKHVDEVLIFDDQSQDDSFRIAEQYIEKNTLIGWKAIRNSTNKGWRKNFFDGIQLATGELIFLCDQDDIWFLDKVEKMAEVLKKRKDISVLASNFTIYLDNEKNSNYQHVANRMDNTSEVTKVPFDYKWYYITRPGSTFCFRKDFFDEIKFNWDVNTAHDCNLWYFAVMQEKMAIFHYSTMAFRRHGNNASSEYLNTRNKRYEAAQMARNINIYFRKFLQEGKTQIIDAIITFCDLRIRFLETGKLSCWVKLFVFYREFYFSSRSCLADLIYFAKK